MKAFIRHFTVLLLAAAVADHALFAFQSAPAGTAQAQPPGPDPARGGGRGGVAQPDGQEITTEKQKFRIEVVAREIETPWGLAFLPDGRLLITERPGRLRILEKGKLSPPVSGLPKVWERQDAGLFDVEVHPQYAKNGWIYLAY